jgi:hypothetical protein
MPVLVGISPGSPRRSDLAAYDGLMGARREALLRFQHECQRDQAIVAAFVGGSIAGHTDDEVSDLDLYAVTRESNYVQFFARRVAFMRTWARPLLMLDTLNHAVGARLIRGCAPPASPSWASKRTPRLPRRRHLVRAHPRQHRRVHTRDWLQAHPDEMFSCRKRRMDEHISERVLALEPSARVLVWVGHDHGPMAKWQPTTYHVSQTPVPVAPDRTATPAVDGILTQLAASGQFSGGRLSPEMVMLSSKRGTGWPIGSRACQTGAIRSSTSGPSGKCSPLSRSSS